MTPDHDPLTGPPGPHLPAWLLLALWAAMVGVAALFSNLT